MVIPKAMRLADLHARRLMTDGQIFTPLWVAKVIWSWIEIMRVEATQHFGIKRFHVMDNSVGSGRLLAYANPAHYTLYGIDIDQNCISLLTEDADEAGFDAHFKTGSMANLHASGMQFAIINPAFSLTLSSPDLTPGLTTRYGLYGANTAATSDEYAIEQAMKAANIVFAVLPTSSRDLINAHWSAQLVAEISLPAKTFISEGANVDTMIFVLDSQRKTPTTGNLTPQRLVLKANGSLSGDLVLPRLAKSQPRDTFFHFKDDASSRPKITLPVTGDNSVTLHHHHRRLILSFRCGLTQARVMNALLREKLDRSIGHRYPQGVRFEGQGRLMLNLYLLQPDPYAAFAETLDIIRTAGGFPEVSPTLTGYFKRCVSEHRQASRPFSRVAQMPIGDAAQTVTARSFGLLRSGTVTASYFKGESLQYRFDDGNHFVSKNGVEQQFNTDSFSRAFCENKAEAEVRYDWRQLFPAKPLHGRGNQGNAVPLWPYQQDDLNEILSHPTGCIVGWDMGLGKARLAIALALAGGMHNLVVVEPGLVPEMKRELDKIGISCDMWQHITQSEQLQSLRKVNLISIALLRKELPGLKSKTFAKALRRHLHTVVVDEGSMLCNGYSKQTSAIKALAPRKLYVLDGTPIRNYPRDVLPLVQLSHGNRAHQPYQQFGTFLEPRLLHSMELARRGLDAFVEDFVVFEWVTAEFADGLRKGAKREIPVIQDLAKFRQWLVPLVKRRVRNEPDCAAFAGCKDPVYLPIHNVDWDDDHLRHYLQVSLTFAEWYTQNRLKLLAGEKGGSLITVLARLEACNAAVNAPFVARENSMALYTPLTSKMRMAIKRLQELVSKGHKVILYTRYPAVTERLQLELDKLQLESVLFHGGISIQERTHALDADFRFGNKSVLLATSGVTQRGLNIEQADYILQYDRDWSGAKEAQMIHRTTRPGQKKQVFVERLHLAGSIDDYIGQMADFKAATANAALDYGDGMSNSNEFIHMDSILEAFCTSIYNMSSHQLMRAI